MEYKVFLTVFITVFLAELGDKTQLATLLFAAEGQNKAWLIFMAASCALVLSSAIGVWAGSILSAHINVKTLHLIAGACFIAIGLWTLIKA